jgi:TolB-like protein
VDFGLAKLAGQTRMTRTGTTLGTVAYLSPEQARGEATDLRTDIWSFGVLLYEMITGVLPFKGEHEHAVIYSALNKEPEPITALRKGVPIELERVVNKAMAKRREDRYQHVDDLLVDLNVVKRRLKNPVTSMLAPSPTGSPEVAKRAKRKGTGFILGLAISVATAVATALVIDRVLENRRQSEPGPHGMAETQSLAVLPFDNLMDDPQQDYFVEGMHEALITSLSKLGSLRVISRTSAMHYKGTEKSLPEIAAELDVDALVEGSVLRVGDRVRITAQLIDGASDKHIWADSYDRDLRNVLVLLNEVARAIAEEIDVVLTPEQEEHLASTRSVNPNAYEAFLRGAHHLNAFTSGDTRKALEYFRQAIEFDSEFAQAYAGLAVTYYSMSVQSFEPALDVMPKAEEAAQKALELDDDLSAAHTAMGFVRLYLDWDWEAAGKEFQRALETDPNNALAYHGYADYLTIKGHLDEAVDQIKRGRQSDPFSRLANVPVAWHLYFARRYDEAIDECHKLLTIEADYPVGDLLMRAYWQLGRPEEAVEELRKTSLARDPEIRKALERGYASSGPEGAMLAVAQSLVTRSKSEYVGPAYIAAFFVQAGRGDPAIEWLENAYGAHEPSLLHLMFGPELDPLRSDRRFIDLRRRMGLPE